MSKQTVAIRLILRNRILELHKYLKQIDKWHDRSEQPLERLHLRNMRDSYTARLETLKEIVEQVELVEIADEAGELD